VNPGLLDKQVGLVRRSLTQLGNGESVVEWVLDPITPISARVKQSSAMKPFVAGKDETQYDFVITIRYRPNINAGTHRIIYLGQTMEITKQPATINRNEYLEMTCRVQREEAANANED
jgi:SPP1 family predicted phage head-tail adaptor